MSPEDWIACAVLGGPVILAAAVFSIAMIQDYRALRHWGRGS